MMQEDTSKTGSRKPAGNREVNIQNQILNFIRKDRALITIFLVSGKKFVGQVVGFDRYTIHIRGRDYDQIVFKHAITNISLPRHVIQRMPGGSDDVALTKEAASSPEAAAPLPPPPPEEPSSLTGSINENGGRHEEE